VLRTKSVYQAIGPNDGLRILATRFRGRGLKRNRYHVWMANLGPSERLLHQFWAGRLGWGAFRRCYRNELLGKSAREPSNKVIKNHGQKFTLRLINQLAKRGNVTLMCHCSTDEPHCHCRVLKLVLTSKF
jgi:uncharacterized protein YeaO (DUF488 family)